MDETRGELARLLQTKSHLLITLRACEWINTTCLPAVQCNVQCAMCNAKWAGLLYCCLLFAVPIWKTDAVNAVMPGSKGFLSLLLPRCNIVFLSKTHLGRFNSCTAPWLLMIFILFICHKVYAQFMLGTLRIENRYLRNVNFVVSDGSQTITSPIQDTSFEGINMYW